MKQNPFNSVILIYISKCLLGTVLCYQLYLAFPEWRLLWTIISLLLVLAPDWDNSIALPINRIQANITGALIGLFCFFLPTSELFKLLIGVVITILICTRFFPNSTRSALAALVIVLMQEGNQPMISYALQRIGAVILGSLVGLAITLLFHAGRLLLLRFFTPASDDG
ncbi:MAG TPA: FUSC family protein [Sphaerochaeta sp.]|nr:FUSC family protein [Sphaerochaeta sp.]